MFVLHMVPALISLLAFSAAAPTANNCSDLIQPLTAKELHKILGKWIFIEGFTNNDIFGNVLDNTDSLWLTLNTTADNNNTLLLEQANRLIPQPHPIHLKGRCLKAPANMTFIDDKTLDVHLPVAATYHRFLQTCIDCLLMYTYTKENTYQALYLFGRNTILAASDLDTVRKQAVCLGFPQPARFHYDTSKELCPM